MNKDKICSCTMMKYKMNEDASVFAYNSEPIPPEPLICEITTYGVKSMKIN